MSKDGRYADNAGAIVGRSLLEIAPFDLVCTTLKIRRTRAATKRGLLSTPPVLTEQAALMGSSAIKSPAPNAENRLPRGGCFSQRGSRGTARLADEPTNADCRSLNKGFPMNIAGIKGNLFSVFQREQNPPKASVFGAFRALNSLT